MRHCVGPSKLGGRPHPLAWLQVQPVLSQVEQRVLLLTGGKDLLLASAEEGPRLKRLLPRSRLKVATAASMLQCSRPVLLHRLLLCRHLHACRPSACGRYQVPAAHIKV